ncbi:Cof-type HAD-IIB family hydrolase [Bacillus sp. N1-1]|jgi:5-amino-6-(5-phospho-D-ribitylamino)uracil phosphatase|uniref:Cof-type HAD-IIB family hydrolase n=1 Tax=Bacillus sp. N1-1 TaxID=2682541 RepID=UPI001317912E|nr:Cof-type HAD-IIB family hydrolase [Bacillus sp. N1-1]QHA91541.1 Cof-type HAD-IIB family hydrolase [Bacillus sp. N1-1]
MTTKPHLIAIDLDGTLLNSEKNISERTKSVIFEAKRQGHHVAIATGRPYRASVRYYNELALDSPIVNFNGAFVHHPLDRSFGTHHSPMELTTAKSIVSSCSDINVKNIMAEVLDDVYLHQHDELIMQNMIINDSSIFTGEIHKNLKDDPTSLLIHPHEQQLADLRQMLRDHHAEMIEHRVWAAPLNIIEIVRVGLNKAVGLQRLAAHFNVPQERIIAFGDEDNDLEMIEYAGTGVAMGNAIEELKNIANDVTVTNEEDGIATFLEERLKLSISDKRQLS